MTENNKILLVDDDERNIFALSAYLKAKKYKVESARDGRECLDKLKEGKYDLYVKVGDTIESVTNHTKRAGYVIAIGKDRAEAVQRAEQIAQNIEIRTQ